MSSLPSASNTARCDFTGRMPLADESGGALIEVALVMPVFLMLMFGVLQFGIVLFGYCNASYASRAAARYASLHSSTSLNPATTASVQAIATPYLWMGSKSASSVTATWPTSNIVGGTVSVTVSVTYNVGLPFSNTKQITIGSTAQRLIVR